MKKYIVNVTNNLIGQYRLLELMQTEQLGKHFIEQVQIRLQSDFLKKLRSETLRKVSKSLDSCTTLHIEESERQEIISRYNNPDEIYRAFIGLFLAHIIRDRLDKRFADNHGKPYKIRGLEETLVS